MASQLLLFVFIDTDRNIFVSLSCQSPVAVSIMRECGEGHQMLDIFFLSSPDTVWYEKNLHIISCGISQY